MGSISGSSLIEILVSLLILSLMLLGFDTMQIIALRETKAAYYFSIATQQLSVLTERLHTLKDSSFEETLTQWNKQNHEVLPSGRGTFRDNVISIFWGNKQMQTCEKDQIGQSGCLRQAYR